MGEKDNGECIKVGDEVRGTFGGSYVVVEVRGTRVLVGCVGVEFKSFRLWWDARGFWR